jgi:hypothetical protein
MSDVEIYLDGTRCAQVAAAARRLNDKAYRNGQISRAEWNRTMRASDATLFAERDAKRLELAAARKRLNQLKLQALQTMMLELENEGEYTRKAKMPRRWRE